MHDSQSLLSVDSSGHVFRPRLGKLAAKHDPRTLRLEKYLRSDFAVPAAFDFGAAVKSFPMFLNDRIGDCTCAALGHYTLSVNANAGKIITIADADILAAYEAVSGYNPATGANDNGAVELDVLKYARTTGIGGHKIGAFGTMQTLNMASVYALMFLGEGIYIGAQLPESVLNASVWDMQTGPIAGGHAIYLHGKDAAGNIKAHTWTRPITITPRFFQRYMDEVHGILSTEMLNGQGKAANGLDVATLNADLAAVIAMDTPPLPVPVDPTPVPVPTPTPTPVPPSNPYILNIPGWQITAQPAASVSDQQFCGALQRTMLEHNRVLKILAK